MTRLFPAFACGFLCALLGFRRSQELRSCSRRLARWTSIMPHIALLLKEETDSLPSILRAAASESGDADRILRAIAFQMEAQPLTYEVGRALPDTLLPEEAACLRRWLKRLTQGSRDLRLQATQECADYLEHLASTTREKNAADAKMWRQLGLLGGACLIIWFM